MTKQVFIPMMIVFSFVVMNTNGAIRRVGAGLNVPNVDYANLQAAHDAAVVGDTIMLYPTPSGWSAVVSKRLVFFGYGYDADTVSGGSTANPGLQAVRGPVSAYIRLQNYTPNATDSSIFEGIDGFTLNNYTDGYWGPFHDTKNIIVRRCKGTIGLKEKEHANWQISQSIISVFNYSNILFKNLVVSNCVINNFQTSSLATQSIMFLNNIFTTGGWNNGGVPCIYKNNVFLWETPFVFEAGSTYQNNVFVTSVTGSKGQNNKFNVNKDAIFFGYSSQGNLSNDGRWTLRTNSPAKGAGEGGIDCGIFAIGSLYPYKLSGIPSIPAFYRLDAPSSTTGSNPYNITFSVRSNN